MTTESVVAVAFTGGVVVLHSVFLLICFVRNLREYQHTSPRIRDWLPWASHTQPPQKRRDQRQNRFEIRLTEIRLECYLSLSRIALHCFAAYAVVFFIRRLLGLQQMADPVVTAIYLAAYIIVFVSQLHPVLVNQNTLCIHYNGLMGMFFSVAAWNAFNNPAAFVHFYPLILLLRIAVSACYPVGGINFVWNLAWGVLGIMANLTSDGACFGISTMSILGRESMVVVFLSLMIWKLDELHTSQVRSDFQATGYLRAKKTMERLLADMCDAVVELDQGLVIRQACPKLAGMLLRHTGTTALKDEEFASLVFNEEERNFFVDFVTQRAVPMEHEENFNDDETSMYLHLKDAYGTPVSVQLFHSCHNDPPDEICHIVGVHEVERPNRSGMRPDTLGQAVQNDRPGGDAESLAVVVGRRDGDEPESVCSLASALRSPGPDEMSAILVPILPEENMLTPVAVAFDAINFEVVACTIGFQSLTGPLPIQTNLRELIVHFNDFSTWARNEVNGFFSEEPPTNFKLKFLPSTGMKQANLEWYADAAIVEVRQGCQVSELGVEQRENVVPNEYQLLAVMALANAESQSRRAKSKANRSRRRGTSPGSRVHLL